VLRADLREIPGDGEFDAVLVVGRVFTHMVTNQDLRSAVDSCRRALRPSGRLFADNYEDTRIQVTKYFNGSIQVQDDRCTIKRDSTTELRSTSPFVVDWRAEYSGVIEGEPFRFSDSIPHRAFSRAEFAEHLGNGGFQVIAQGDNFDETSFFTVSRRAT
jgi:SAM-dependent methyltransferase